MLNFQKVDRGGPFPWPDPKDLLAAQLALTLQVLNEESIEVFLGHRRANMNLAHKEIDIADLSKPAQERLEEIFPEFRVDVDLVVYEFTVCYRFGDPRRIWATYDSPQRCFSPIWWDPEHRVIGHDPRQAGKASGLCGPDCPHPSDMDQPPS